ncbi:MAG: Mur ligase domain-containing protein [Christensenellaceae bacterium]
MLLSELARCVGGARIVCGAKNMQTSENTQIRGLTADSRFCSTGDLFFCLTGGKTDSHVYARDAEEAGAAAVVTERELELKIPQLVVPDSRAAMGLIASAFYDHAAEKLKIIGITGTNGKTTTSYMLASVLRRAERRWRWSGRWGSITAKSRSRPN